MCRVMSCDAISAVSPAPVYGTFETYFDQGIVAGIDGKLTPTAGV